jgi:hypothetical protein
MPLHALALRQESLWLQWVGLGFWALCGCQVDGRTLDVAMAPQRPATAEAGAGEPGAGEPGADAGAGDVTPPDEPVLPCSDGDSAPCEPCVMATSEVCDAHPGLDGKGRCTAGSRTCEAGDGGASSAFGVCRGSVGPIEEVCGNGVDDDCDGQIDPVAACGTCRDNPCQNGGVCQDVEGGYRCTCRGFLGDDCELPMFERLIPVEGQTNALLVSLSDDGRLGAGFCLTPERGGPPNTPVRWTSGQGFTSVAGYPSEPAQYISGDGAVFADTDVRTADGVTATLAASNSAGSELYESYLVQSINRNGSVLAGVGIFSDGSVGHFRWSESSGFLAIPTVGGSYDAPPMVSSDGSIVVGGDRNGAYRFSTATGLQTIVPDGGATDVSSNGSVVVGVRNSESGGVIFRWTEAAGAVDLPGDCSRPMLSLDGARLALTCSDPFTGASNVEIESAGERARLVDVLVAEGAPDVPPQLQLAEVMSGDGKTLAGQYGDAESGLQFLWVARLR